MKDKIVIFDTTLRDGEQSPGASMTLDEKVRIAKQLERMKVDVIEAGFAQASPGDFASIEAVARAVKDSTICSLARAQEQDIRRAGEAIKPANSGRIHTFIATSPIHMEKKLRMSADQVVAAAIDAIKLAKQYTDNIEFSAEDAVRSEFDFLCRIFDAAIKAGATTINVPDTVGYSIPYHWGDLFKRLINTVANADKVVWSSHCHNDLGMAVANSLAAVECGARQVECTINGIGERAGNAALEEIVMAIKTRSDLFSVYTDIDASQIVSASKLVSQITGYHVQPNKAIVGANAFAHESGIHQDGVIKHRETYEIMRAQDVGWNENKLVLGKLSGRNAFKMRLSELGYEFPDDTSLNAAFARFKELADKKQEIFDDDLQALITEGQIEVAQDYYRYHFSQVSSISGKTPEAEIKLLVDNVECSATAKGSGPVDAIFSAIEKIAKSESQLLLYSVNNITTGTDAQGEVTVRLSKNDRIVNGQGADTDIIIASAKAYLNALNRLHSALVKMNPQESV